LPRSARHSHVRGQELQTDLRACIAVVEEATEEFDREDAGGLITFVEGE